MAFFSQIDSEFMGRWGIGSFLGRLPLAAAFILFATKGYGSTINDVESALQSLQERFTYRAEPEGRDDWHILPDEGRVEGDCEDFALTLRAIIGGQIYIVQDNAKSEPHALLCGVGWCVDNIQPSTFDVDIRNHKYVIRISDKEIELRLRKARSVR